MLSRSSDNEYERHSEISDTKETTTLEEYQKQKSAKTKKGKRAPTQKKSGQNRKSEREETQLG